MCLNYNMNFLSELNTTVINLTSKVELSGPEGSGSTEIESSASPENTEDTAEPIKESKDVQKGIFMKTIFVITIKFNGLQMVDAYNTYDFLLSDLLEL